MNQLSQPNESKSHISQWILAILSIVYTISPIDIIPDIPVVGWVDDLFIGAAGVLNLVQAYAGDISIHLERIVKMIKWTIIILGIIATLLVLLLGTLIVKLFTE